MKKIISLIAAAVMCLNLCAAVSAEGSSYTFSGTKIATPGGTADAKDAPIADGITVTTSGDINYKCAAITDTAHNSECGFYPIGGGFTANGSYMYLATGNTNDNSVFTLNMPVIKKGSKVTLTFAKPIVTNNGSTRRNTNDPYAYFKIADRYISINGDNFDQWRTESVVTGEDTDSIVFTCDKWGAVAIESITIEDAADSKLCSLSAKSAQYANMEVNGVKFFAGADGSLEPMTFSEGDSVTVKASKDGYASAEKTVVISGDTELDIPLECETDAVYYESDFGNKAGTLELDGSFTFGDGIAAKEQTRVFANVTFSEGGSLKIVSDAGEAVKLEYKDGIYCGGELITAKDNMEFGTVFDKVLGKAVLEQNGKSTVIENSSCFDKLLSVEGSGVKVEYIGVSHPDMGKLTIEGPNRIYRFDSSAAYADTYTISSEYLRPGENIAVVSNADGAVSEDGAYIVGRVADGVSGVVITASYGGGTAEKNVEVERDPEFDIPVAERTINLHETKRFPSELTAEENGRSFSVKPEQFTSSDGSVLRASADGMLCAKAKGAATLSFKTNASDKSFAADYTVERYYIGGMTEADTTYVIDDFSEDEYITGYKASYSDGISEETEPADIPAAEIKADGSVITLCYDSDGTLVSALPEAVKAGDKVAVSNGSKKVYFNDGKSFSELTEADTTVKGFALKHSAGEKYEISPIYRFDNIGDVKDEGKTLDHTFAEGLYDITLKKAEPRRGDIFINGYMVGNNVDQADADRKVTDGNLYKAEDIKVGSRITVSMTDGSTMLDYVTVEKKPEFYERPQRVYIIGDSLACIYYGDFEQEVGGGRAGWGQQLPDFLDMPVTNLANSGQYAAGLYVTAFPSVIENGVEGDILLIECAYNDRNYSNRAEMTACVKSMIEKCREKGIRPVLVTPNASRHDYKPSVAWSGYLRDIAVDTECELIDLSKESYDFLYSLYGDDKDNVVTMNYNLTAVGGDTLHSSYAGAYKWAAIVASGMERLGIDGVNTEFSYTFTDTLGNEITAKAE